MNVFLARLALFVRAALILLVAATPDGATSDGVPPHVLCGDDHWFTLDEPDGWSTEHIP